MVVNDNEEKPVTLQRTQVFREQVRFYRFCNDFHV